MTGVKVEKEEDCKFLENKLHSTMYRIEIIRKRRGLETRRDRGTQRRRRAEDWEYKKCSMLWHKKVVATSQPTGKRGWSAMGNRA